MKRFMDSEFLLNTETASKLFSDYAKDAPIIDTGMARRRSLQVALHALMRR